MEEIVKYQNDMNKLNFKGFTQMDMNIFMALCAQMKEKDTTEILLSFSEIKRIIHYEKKNSTEEFIADLKRMNQKLMSVNCEIITRTEIIMFVLFPTFKINADEETLKIAVNKDFTWLLNEMRSYTTFELAEFIGLKSKYAKNLYRLLKQWRNNGTYTFHDLEQFKELMDIPQSYSNKIMMRDCVNMAIEEISKLDKSFQNFKCTPDYARKRGRPLEKLIFTWDTTAIPPTVPTAEQTGFSDQQTFEEYMKGYQGEDKPTPLDLKIAKDIQKSRQKKDSKKPKKNAFNNFNQREYDNEVLEKLLFADRTEKKLTEEERAELMKQAVIKNEPKQKNTVRTSKKELIQEYVLAHPNDNVSQIAENLGISRTTVYKYMDNIKPKTPKQPKKDIKGTLESLSPQKTEFEANTKPQKQIPEDETPEQRKRRRHREWQEKINSRHKD